MERDSATGNAEPAADTPTATVRRVTAVLDAFLAADRELGVTELAGRLGLAKSVIHRLVTALTDAEYLLQTAESRRYVLGPKAVRLGLVALGQLNISDRAPAYLRALAAETEETATLSVLVDDHRVYAEQVESGQTVRQTVQVGATAPLYLGASSKAILAFLPSARRTAILQAAEAVTATRADGTPIVATELAGELAAVQRRGYATSQSERVLGATSAAAPIFDRHGAVVGSISVAGVTVRHSAADLSRFGRLAREYARRLSVELGWPSVPASQETP